MYNTIVVTDTNGTQYYYNSRKRELDRADNVIVDEDTEQYHCDQSDVEICREICAEKWLTIADITLI
jgi:hypothetical protein